MMVAPPLLSRHGIGHERQCCSRAVNVILHRGRPAHPDRADNLSVHLDGKASAVRRHARKRGKASQKRRVALDEVEKVLGGYAEQSRVRLVLRNLDGTNRSPIPPAKALVFASIILNPAVLANT